MFPVGYCICLCRCQCNANVICVCLPPCLVKSPVYPNPTLLVPGSPCWTWQNNRPQKNWGTHPVHHRGSGEPRPTHLREGIRAARPHQLPRRRSPPFTVPARDHVPPADGTPRHWQPWLEGGDHPVSGESPIPCRNPISRRWFQQSIHSRPSAQPPSPRCSERMPEPTADGEPKPAATDEPSPHRATVLRSDAEPEPLTSVKVREPATVPATWENATDSQSMEKSSAPCIVAEDELVIQLGLLDMEEDRIDWETDLEIELAPLLSVVSAGPAQLTFVSAGPAQLAFISAGPAQLTFVFAGPVQFSTSRASPSVSASPVPSNARSETAPSRARSSPAPPCCRSSPMPASAGSSPAPLVALLANSRHCRLLASAPLWPLLTKARQCQLLTSAPLWPLFASAGSSQAPSSAGSSPAPSSASSSPAPSSACSLSASPSARISRASCPSCSASRAPPEARSVPGARRVHSGARSVPGARRVHSRARSVPGARRNHSRARSGSVDHKIHSRACSGPGAHGVHSGTPPRDYGLPKEDLGGGGGVLPTMAHGIAWSAMAARVPGSPMATRIICSVPERAPPWRPPVLSPCPLRPPECPPALPIGCYTARDVPVGRGGNVRLCFPLPCVSMPIYGPSCFLSLVY